MYYGQSETRRLPDWALRLVVQMILVAVCSVVWSVGLLLWGWAASAATVIKLFGLCLSSLAFVAMEYLSRGVELLWWFGVRLVVFIVLYLVVVFCIWTLDRWETSRRWERRRALCAAQKRKQKSKSVSWSAYNEVCLSGERVPMKEAAEEPRFAAPKLQEKKKKKKSVSWSMLNGVLRMPAEHDRPLDLRRVRWVRMKEPLERWASPYAAYVYDRTPRMQEAAEGRSSGKFKKRVWWADLDTIFVYQEESLVSSYSRREWVPMKKPAEDPNAEPDLLVAALASDFARLRLDDSESRFMKELLRIVQEDPMLEGDDD